MTNAIFSSFIVTETMESQLRLMPDDLRLKFYDALLRFGLHGEEPDFSGMELVAWVPMRDMILYAKQKDETFREKQRVNGKKGGRPKSQDETQNPQEPNDNQDETQNPDKPKKPSESQKSPNGNGNGNENVNVNLKGESVKQNETDLSKPDQLFLHYWQCNPDIFNITAGFDDFERWQRYWSTSPPTCEQIKTAMENFIADVNSGNIERRYIPSKPDKFIFGNWINSCQERRKKPEKHREPEEPERNIGTRRVINETRTQRQVMIDEYQKAQLAEALRQKTGEENNGEPP